MAYVLLPDGFTLKSVTKAQQNAVDDYFGRERRSDYLDNILKNPEIIKQIILTGFAFLAIKEGKDALTDLKDLGVNISQGAEDAYTKKRAVKFGDFIAPVGVSLEDVVDEAISRIPFL